jgi:hypothetical protein
MIKDLWYKNTVIYSLDLETFNDTNGDGIGDFEGLIRRLDYLHTLVIGGIRIRCSTGWSEWSGCARNARKWVGATERS